MKKIKVIIACCALIAIIAVSYGMWSTRVFEESVGSDISYYIYNPYDDTSLMNGLVSYSHGMPREWLTRDEAEEKVALLKCEGKTPVPFAFLVPSELGISLSNIYFETKEGDGYYADVINSLSLIEGGGKRFVSFDAKYANWLKKMNKNCAIEDYERGTKWEG